MPKPPSGPGVPERIILAASRERPADAVLREELKAHRDILPQDARAIAQTVFTYFRWRGWLDLSKPLITQIRQSRELAQAFAEKPESVSEAELAARAAPEWVWNEMSLGQQAGSGAPSPLVPSPAGAGAGRGEGNQLILSAWARALQTPPKLWLRAQRGQGRALAEKLGAAKLEKTLLPDVLHYKGEEDLFKRPEFHTGEFEIQDIASQAVGWLCAPQPGETWWDACAGEGGKTLHLSALMQNKGLIWASDRAEWRLKNLKRRAARAKVFNFRAAAWDGDAKLPTKTKFDGILVDAPCSGVGTWQRNPHARWTATAEDVAELAAVQKQLLANVAGSVKPGGKLIYSVCTLTRAETETVVAEFSGAHPDFEPLTLPQLESQSVITSFPAVTLWPQDLGGNGMFIAGWRRKR
jgi:16S rRNA (cytosine967-C5)-methyltransferase